MIFQFFFSVELRACASPLFLFLSFPFSFALFLLLKLSYRRFKEWMGEEWATYDEMATTTTTTTTIITNPE